MNLFKKNIILIPSDYDGMSNQKGILSLEFFEDKVKCTLKCFNLKQTDEKLTVGVSVGDKIHKASALAKDLNSLSFVIPSSVSNSSKISCVVVCVHEKTYDTILWGSTETTKAIQNHILIENMLEGIGVFEKSPSGDKSDYNAFPKYNPYTSNENFKVAESNLQRVSDRQDEIFEEEQLEEYIDKVVAETESRYRRPQRQKYMEEETSNKSRSRRFYDRVEGQISELFSNNQPETQLEQIIPSSKFCKVMSDDNYYVFGVIYEEDRVKYICYGIPAIYSETQPKELEGFCQWLPTDADNFKGEGYWMSYQDADDGKNISVEVI